MDLTLAISMAGHDKKQVYVVIDEDEQFCSLANGTTKTMAKPKRKKKMHLQLIRKVPDCVLDELKAINTLDDVSIKKILKSYNRRNKDV